MKNAAKVVLTGRPASNADGHAEVSFNSTLLAGAVLEGWRTWRRTGSDLTIEFEAGPSAFVVAERLGQAARETRTVEGYVAVQGLGSFEGVWTVPAILHTHGEPSDMVATLKPAPGTFVTFTPAPPVEAPVVAPVAKPAPVAAKTTATKAEKAKEAADEAATPPAAETPPAA